jgi:hypothetical protein
MIIVFRHVVNGYIDILIAYGRGDLFSWRDLHLRFFRSVNPVIAEIFFGIGIPGKNSSVPEPV